MSIQFEAGSLRTTIMNINKLIVTEKAAAQKAMTAAGKVLARQVRKNISLRDHSPKQLAAMGHPYARRHGSIAIHRKGSKSLVNPEFRVHTNSGDLLNSVVSKQGSGTMANWRVSFDTGVAPHAVYVVMGTRVMLGRDVLWSTANAPYTRLLMMKAIVKKLGPGMRSGAAVRFDAASRPMSPGGSLET